jgi:uncharacterized protein (DUF4213/DUF364 family)
MRLRDRLKAASLELVGSHKVRDVRLGLGYTAVALENGQLGVAYSFLDGIGGGCSVYEGVRPIAGRSAMDLVHLFDNENALDSSLALACANALFNTANQPYTEGASITQLDFQATDRVGMVGHFAPIVNKILPRVAAVEIFERQSQPEKGIRNIDEAADILPLCDIALVTSTSIINNTVDQVLALLDQCREVVMLGTSTPMSKAVFADTPVTLLSGIVVNDATGVLQAVSEAGGTPAIRAYTHKVNLRVCS